MECYQCLEHREGGTYSGPHWYCVKCFCLYIVGIPNMKDEQEHSQAMQAHIKASDIQEGGSHYMDMPIQPFDYIYRNGIGYAEGNVIKYVSRWQYKNGIEDLRKARHYLDLMIDAEAGK